jgi:hypothetical protein
MARPPFYIHPNRVENFHPFPSDHPKLLSPFFSFLSPSPVSSSFPPLALTYCYRYDILPMKSSLKHPKKLQPSSTASLPTTSPIDLQQLIPINLCLLDSSVTSLEELHYIPRENSFIPVTSNFSTPLFPFTFDYRPHEALSSPESFFQSTSPRLDYNQFNYIDRSTQTIRNRIIDGSSQTPSFLYSEASIQADVSSFAEPSSISHTLSPQPTPLQQSTSIMERLICATTNMDILIDYKYWMTSNTFLSLWEFPPSDQIHHHQTVSLCYWMNKTLFFVLVRPTRKDVPGKSTCTFYSIRGAAPCTFTMKDSYKVHEIEFPCNIISFDHHPSNHEFLLFGSYDGQVFIYDIQLHQFVAQSEGSRSLKGLNVISKSPLWTVKWRNSRTPSPSSLNEETFYSVNKNGIVTTWTFSFLSIQLGLPIKDRISSMESFAHSSQPTCMDLHYSNEGIGEFLIGTEDGSVLRVDLNSGNIYSTLRSVTPTCHRGPINGVVWHLENPSIALSYGIDQNLKIWKVDETALKVLCTFNVSSNIQHALWSSTHCIFLSTTDGRLLYIDLSLDSTTPICDQKILASGFIQHISINPASSLDTLILLLGYSNGTSSIVKFIPPKNETSNNQKGNTLF